MFPGLVDDPAQRAAFRECLRFMAKARRQVPLTPRDVADLNALAQASYVVEVEGETVGVSEPLPERTVEDVLSESERTVEDVLSESAVDLKAADAAEALAAAFEERS
jgi:hypothetical protein